MHDTIKLIKDLCSYFSFFEWFITSYHSSEEFLANKQKLEWKKSFLEKEYLFVFFKEKYMKKGCGWIDIFTLHWNKGYSRSKILYFLLIFNSKYSTLLDNLTLINTNLYIFFNLLWIILTSKLYIKLSLTLVLLHISKYFLYHINNEAVVV